MSWISAGRLELLKGAMSSLGTNFNLADRDVADGSESTTSESAARVPDLMAPLEEDATQSVNIPPWMRELAASGLTRQSRASSIISTRTRFSTNTFQDDARSIDINVGGQYFRISRDGSQINDAPPPPYSGPLGLSTPTTQRGGRAGPVLNNQHLTGGPTLQNRPVVAAPRLQTSPALVDGSIRANILNPSEVDIPSPVDGNLTRQIPSGDESERDSSTAPIRNPSYKTGPDAIDVVSDARRMRTVSQNDLPTASVRETLTSPLRRRNGVRLPSLITQPVEEPRNTSSRVATHAFSLGTSSPLRIRSAGPILSTLGAADVPQSPTYIGRNARGVFPVHKSPSGAQPVRETENNAASYSNTTINQPPIADVDGSDERDTPFPMDTENDISLHYARLMRRLDRDHRKALHLKDRELAQYRERLNEVDTVYRQELRARDFVIEDLKKRLAHLEESTEIMMETARNQVEDLWEGRWKAQESHLRERMKKIEEDAQKAINAMQAGG